MSTLLTDRLVRLPPATTPHLIGTDNPLDACTALILESNLRWLARECAYRPLVNVRDDLGVYRVLGTVTGNDLQHTHVDWNSDDVHGFCLGTFALWPDDGRSLPALKLRGYWRAPSGGGSTLWVALWIAPGRNRWLGSESTPRRSAVAVCTSTTVAGDLLVEYQLQATDLEPDGTRATVSPGIGDGSVREPCSQRVVTAWLGAACSSNNASAKGLLSGLTLSAEPF